MPRLPNRSTEPRSALRRGIALIDLVSTVALVLLTIAIFVLATRGYVAARREAELQRSLRLAAETALNEARVGIAPRDAAGESAAQRDVTVEISRVPGDGPWRGFTLLRAVASRRLPAGRVAKVELATYLAEGANP